MPQWFAVAVDYHQFHLSTSDADPTAPAETGSVCDTGVGFATVHTGIATGPVMTAVDVLSVEPDADFSGWDNVTEVSIVASTPVQIITAMGEVVDVLGTIVPPASGSLRVRIHTRGRAENWDGIVEVPSETYWIQAWPEPAPQPMRGLKATDGIWEGSESAEPVEDVDVAADATVRVRGPVVWPPD